VKHLTLS